MIGHKGHPEVEGTIGQLSEGIHLVEDEADVAKVNPKQTELLAVVTQTTLSVDDASRYQGRHQGATFRCARAQAARHLLRHTKPPGCGENFGPAGGCGDSGGPVPASSNSNRLRELAARSGTPRVHGTSSRRSCSKCRLIRPPAWA